MVGQPLSANDVSRIVLEAVQATSPKLQVVGITLGGLDSDYVEVLINVLGRDNGPFRLQLGAFRDAGAAALHDEIVRKLREHAIY